MLEKDIWPRKQPDFTALLKYVDLIKSRKDIIKCKEIDDRITLY